MVETGSSESLPGPAATADPLLLVVAGVVVVGGRGDAGLPPHVTVDGARTGEAR